MSINHYSLDLPETTLWWTQQQQQQQQQQQPILMEPIQNPSFPGPPINPYRPPHHQHQPTWFNSHTTLDPSFLHYPTTTTTRLHLNNQNDNEVEDNDKYDVDDNDDEEEDATTSQQGAEEEKEHMFEKPLTPSDVGKLNRLVIPKQHAEKYFPLGASGRGGDSGECKGLLLSFEDESGKCWRFRYSYWNSSQSYVLTKGWSRYVKDKRLDAGDVVLFERHRDDAQRLFIRWRRRRPNGSSSVPAHVSGMGHGKSSGGGDNGNEVGGGVGVRWTRGFYPAHPYPTHQPMPYQHECLHTGRGFHGQNQRAKTAGNSPSSSSSSTSRVLRLFGVNMECQPENDSGPSTPEGSSYNNMPSSQGTETPHFYHHHEPSSYSSNPNPHLVRQHPYYY